MRTTSLFPSWIDIVCPQSETRHYGAVAESVVGIPDSLIGLGPVRNHCLSMFPEQCIIMLDDDITQLYCITGEKARRVEDPDEVVDVLVQLTTMAMDLGVSAYGTSMVDIRKYNPSLPFAFTGFLSGCIGVNGRKFEFINHRFKVDFDFCLQCLLVERRILIDNRYFFLQCKESNQGGNALFRNKQDVDAEIERLEKKWGKYCRFVRGTNENYKVKNCVVRKQSIQVD